MTETYKEEAIANIGEDIMLSEAAEEEAEQDYLEARALLSHNGD